MSSALLTEVVCETALPEANPQHPPLHAGVQRPAAEAQRLSTSQSLLLDVIRVSAAVVVAVGHLTQRTFSTGWPNLTPYAVGAVQVFFVLSGFVIRYATKSRRGTLGSYAMDRASRVYSVALPALLLTAVTDTIARRVNPAYYHLWVRPHPLMTILQNAMFLGEYRHHHVAPMSNAPFWSLNYEVLYYVIYGFALYLTGTRRWGLIALTVLLMGPKVMYLLPIWWMGCYGHDLYQWWNVEDGRKARKIAGSLAAILAASGIVYAVFQLPWVIRMEQRVHFYSGINYVEAVVTLVVMLVLLQMMRRIDLDPNKWAVRSTRYIAEATFPVYLIHFPLFILAGAVLPYDHGSGWQKVFLLLSILGLGVLMGQQCNKLKLVMRRWGKRLLGESNPRRPPVRSPNKTAAWRLLR